MISPPLDFRANCPFKGLSSTIQTQAIDHNRMLNNLEDDLELFNDNIKRVLNKEVEQKIECLSHVAT